MEKLTKTQKAVIEAMEAGATIRRRSGLYPSWTLVTDKDDKKIAQKTFFAIEDAGLLTVKDKGYPWTIYKLKSQLTKYECTLDDIVNILNGPGSDMGLKAVKITKYFRDKVSSKVMQECVETYKKSAQIEQYNRILTEMGLQPEPEIKRLETCPECGRRDGETCTRYVGTNCSFQNV